MNIVCRRVLVLAGLLLSVGLGAVEPNKSPNDPRHYRAYTLDNGLKVLLVSDSEAGKAAAALDVAVGSGADPVKRQGLAHFLEHMLFLGTSKYPKSGEYQDFISAHGGSHNAYTSFRHTNYFFDVDAAYLEPALDRFAQFFTAPLFNAEYVRREIYAVDSEYRAKLKDDARRSLDVFKTVINPDHPFSKLAVGNVQTLLGGGPGSNLLPDDASMTALREELLAFYAQHYSADRMALVVIGEEPLDTLAAWVNDKFAAVPRAEQPPAAEAVPLFQKGRLPAQVSLRPEKDSRSLGVTFPIPELEPHYRSKPTQYIGNIIGHEGPGSLLSWLKTRGWAESLSAGAGLEYSGGATFNVSISLTEEGLQHQDAIVEALFHLIEEIRRSGIQRWRHKEQKGIMDVAFRFQEKGRSIGYASHLASVMHRYEQRDILGGDYRLDKYKPRLIRSFLGYLQPENALITLMSPSQETSSSSPWYATPYQLSEQSEARLKQWRNPAAIEAISLPEKNPFVASEFALKNKQGAGAAPQLIRDSKSMRIWWAGAAGFAIPKAQLHISIESPSARSDVRAAALSQLLADVVSDGLNENSYPAYLAGIHFQVRRHMRGLSIGIGGFDHRQDLLLEKIAAAFALPGLEASRLENLRVERVRSWRNAKKRLPYQQLFGAVNQALIDRVWSAEELADALQAVSLSEFQAYAKAFFQSARLDVLGVGNLGKEELIRQADLIATAAQCSTDKACTPATRQVLHLPDDIPQGLTVDIDHADSALLYYLQAEDQSDRSRALYALTARVVKADYFQQLRTEQQLGYIVFAGGMPLLDVPGMIFVVQSPGHSVADIGRATEEFLEGQRKELEGEAMQAAFEQHREALLSELQEPAKNMAEQADRYWGDLALGYSGFDRRQRLIDAVNSVSFKQWAAFFTERINAGLMVWSAGTAAQQKAPAGYTVRASAAELENSGWFTVGSSLEQPEAQSR